MAHKSDALSHTLPDNQLRLAMGPEANPHCCPRQLRILALPSPVAADPQEWTLLTFLQEVL